jgi:hypothetical protein
VELRLRPAPPPTVHAAVRAALAAAGIAMDEPPPAYGGAWRRAGLEEGVARQPGTGPGSDGGEGYPLSPRRTLGALRA